MSKRKLRIVKRQSPDTLGICEACNQQFASNLPQADKAEWEISTLFSRHKCKPEDASQAAARIVREATES
jgi:hypothetical protein